MKGVFVDTTKWDLKTARVKLKFYIAAEKLLLEAAQDVYNCTKENLKGPGLPKYPSGSVNYKKAKAQGYDTKSMPIARPTGTLNRSLTMTPLSALNYAIWVDPKIADYGKYVHDGHKTISGSVVQPRRFLGDVITGKRPQILSKIKKELTKAIQSEGRK